MQYMASITRFFDHPNKWMNLLMLGVCFLIPVVGPIIVAGYCLVVLVHDLRKPGEMFPEFTFDLFVEYLKAGLWPFLVSLVASVVLIPLMLCTCLPMFLGPITQSEIGALIGLLLSVLLHLVAIVIYMAVLMPMMLRAGLEQNFAAGFKFSFIKDFIGKVWTELALAMLFLMVAGMVLGLAGMLVCFVGMYAAAGVMNFANYQLYRQLYELYLERGGETIEVSPELLALVEGDDDEEGDAADAGAEAPAGA